MVVIKYEMCKINMVCPNYEFNANFWTSGGLYHLLFDLLELVKTSSDGYLSDGIFEKKT